MSPLMIVIMATLIAGLAMPLGAILSSLENTDNQWIGEEVRHGVMAFGGGALLSAVAFSLVPDSIHHVTPIEASIAVIVGGLAFMSLDIYLTKQNTSASNLAAMLSDFIPESIALGAAFVSGSSSAYLLAVLIFLQNIPEGFSAFRELKLSTDINARKIIMLFTGAALLGPIAGISGYLWLADYPTVVAYIMLFASGGILYSIFQDIAPQVKLERHWLPPMGAVLGFVVGIVGVMVTQ